MLRGVVYHLDCLVGYFFVSNRESGLIVASTHYKKRPMLMLMLLVIIIISSVSERLEGNYCVVEFLRLWLGKHEVMLGADT